MTVKEIRKELETLRKIARFAMPDFVEDIDKALEALPGTDVARALAQRVLEGGSDLRHYPSLKGLTESR